MANLTWPGYETRNDQKASKMAAKVKMAAENIDSKLLGQQTFKLNKKDYFDF